MWKLYWFCSFVYLTVRGWTIVHIVAILLIAVLLAMLFEADASEQAARDEYNSLGPDDDQTAYERYISDDD